MQLRPACIQNNIRRLARSNLVYADFIYGIIDYLGALTTASISTISVTCVCMASRKVKIDKSINSKQTKFNLREMFQNLPISIKLVPTCRYHYRYRNDHPHYRQFRFTQSRITVV